MYRLVQWELTGQVAAETDGGGGAPSEKRDKRHQHSGSVSPDHTRELDDADETGNRGPGLNRPINFNITATGAGQGQTGDENNRKEAFHGGPPKLIS